MSPYKEGLHFNLMVEKVKRVMASISTSKACIMPVEISDGNCRTYVHSTWS